MFNLTEDELNMVKAGMTDGCLKKAPKVELNTYGPKIDTMAQARIAAGAEAEKKTAATFLQKAATEEGAQKTTTGMVYKVITPGTGASPQATDRVKVPPPEDVQKGGLRQLFAETIRSLGRLASAG